MLRFFGISISGMVVSKGNRRSMMTLRIVILNKSDIEVNTLVPPEEDENHNGHSSDREEGGDSNEFGGFDIVAAVFGGEKAERSGSREGLDEGANLDNFGWKVNGGENPVGNDWA